MVNVNCTTKCSRCLSNNSFLLNYLVLSYANHELRAHTSHYYALRARELLSSVWKILQCNCTHFSSDHQPMLDWESVRRTFVHSQWQHSALTSFFTLVFRSFDRFFFFTIIHFCFALLFVWPLRASTKALPKQITVLFRWINANSIEENSRNCRRRRRSALLLLLQYFFALRHLLFGFVFLSFHLKLQSCGKNVNIESRLTANKKLDKWFQWCANVVTHRCTRAAMPTKSRKMAQIEERKREGKHLLHDANEMHLIYDSIQKQIQFNSIQFHSIIQLFIN